MDKPCDLESHLSFGLLSLDFLSMRQVTAVVVNVVGSELEATCKIFMTFDRGTIHYNYLSDLRELS